MRLIKRLLLITGFVGVAAIGYLANGDVKPALAAQCCDECDDWFNYCMNDPAPQLVDFCESEVPRLRDLCQRTCHMCGQPE